MEPSYPVGPHYPLTAKTTPRLRHCNTSEMAETRMGEECVFLLGGDTVDGSEIRRENHLECTKPWKYKLMGWTTYPPVQDFFHQQYVWFWVAKKSTDRLGDSSLRHTFR